MSEKYDDVVKKANLLIKLSIPKKLKVLNKVEQQKKMLAKNSKSSVMHGGQD